MTLLIVFWKFPFRKAHTRYDHFAQWASSLLALLLPLSSDNANLFFFPQSQYHQRSTYLCQLESFDPDQFKNCSVHPLLEKSNFDKENLSNLIKIGIVATYPNSQKDLLKTDLLHLNENNLVNSFQSAYTKFNSTETTLLAVYDGIIRAMSQQKSHWSVSSWSFCRLWHYWPYHSSTSTQILVWFHWHCLILDSVLPFISFLYCWYQSWHQISSL